MAVTDAAIFKFRALWRHTTQIEYENQIIKGFQEYFCNKFL